jgi:hypothetical protein
MNENVLKHVIDVLENCGYTVDCKPHNNGVQLTITPDANKEVPFCYPEHDDNSYSVIE